MSGVPDGSRLDCVGGGDGGAREQRRLRLRLATLEVSEVCFDPASADGVYSKPARQLNRAAE